MSRIGVFGTILHESSFGGLRIDIQMTEDEENEALARFKYPHVKGASIDHMGGEGRVTKAKVIFMPLAGDDHPTVFRERFDLFRKLKEKGDTQTFVHPLDGNIQAKLGAFSWSMSPDIWDAIVVDCTFEEDTEVVTQYKSGPGTSLQSAVVQVNAAGAAFDAALAKEPTLIARNPNNISSDCNDTVSAWVNLQKTGRQVNLELVRLSNKIAKAMDDYEVATNVRRYPIMVSLSNLNANLRQAAETIKQSTPRLIDITVLSPMPLLVVAAKKYGARDAAKRAAEISALNDIKNPARIEGATVLKGQAPQTQVGRRSAA